MHPSFSFTISQARDVRHWAVAVNGVGQCEWSPVATPMPDLPTILTTAIDMHEAMLRATIPDDREAALVAIVRAQDQLLGGIDLSQTPPFDPIHGSRLANPGGSLALSLVLAPENRAAPHGGWSHQPTGYGVAPARDADHWADTFLAACADLADARQVQAHLASGFMRGEIKADGSLAVWIAQKRFPPAWRERIDLAWLDARSRRSSDHSDLEAMDWQLGYLPDAVLADIPAQGWMDAVRVLAERYADAEGPVPETTVLETLTMALNIEPEIAAHILSALTLDASNATTAWHATVPGIATAPFVRVGSETLMPSRFGLRTEPLRFLARELRRRDPQHWHNAAHQREAAFRKDLERLFADKRFVHAPTRIQLRRDEGSLRTDIDAAIFDRKTGTLALIELKSQDPYSRSPEELERRRDSLLAANRQLSGILDWTKRHSPDEILDRIDHQTAKRFHVQRVLPFVLARTLVRFNDGPTPDKRAAWGTWPDVLRLHDAGVLDPASGNPLQTLFTRMQAVTDPPIPANTPSRSVRLGDVTITVSADRRRGEN